MKKPLSPFQFTKYRQFIAAYLDQAPRGTRSRLASGIGVKSSFLSRVLAEQADFSLEQTEACSRFMSLKQIESDFLIALVSVERAGTEALRVYWNRQLEYLKKEAQILEKRSNVGQGLKRTELLNEYYSTWKPSTVHVATSIPAMQTLPALARGLGLSLLETQRILEFLTKAELVEKSQSKFKLKTGNIHLPKGSLLANRQLTNWNLKAIEKMQNPRDQDLHYAQVIALSQKDLVLVREHMMDLIQEIQKIVQPSPEEAVAAYTMNLFSLMESGKNP